MSVTPSDIEKVALLARLAIAETDLPDVTERFSRVLTLVNELNTIIQRVLFRCLTPMTWSNAFAQIA